MSFRTGDRAARLAARAKADASHRRRGRCVIEGLEGRVHWSATPLAATVSAPATLAAASARGPVVLQSNPSDGAVNVAIDTAITADVLIPNGGINAATLTPKTVRLVRASDNHDVPAVLNTSGGGDVIVLVPRSLLESNTQYTFIVTSGLQDVTGIAFSAVRRTFTTGAAAANTTLPTVKFDQVVLTKSAGHDFFGLTLGPDHQLYASTSDGLILRFPLDADGTVGAPTTIDTIEVNNGGAARFVIGMAFDPASTAANPILWVSHTGSSSLDLGGAAGADWSGKISRLSGPDLSDYHDAVIGLPRSIRDHVTSQPVFGPDGAIYFCQPSNTSTGAPDSAWGYRPEHLLNASILRLDLKKLGDIPLNAKTEGAGAYDPFVAGAPLTIYAEGLRNSFDLVWATDGHLYAAANGSASGGATPPGPGVPAIAQVQESETDYLFRVDQGAYYGHPNPLQQHYVLNGGNPTSGEDPYEASGYPVGTQPDPDWHPAIFDLGPHEAPVGMLQYKGQLFGGALDGMLLIARYSGGDDIATIDLTGAAGKPIQYTRMSGMTGLSNPGDLIEDPSTGALYVSELGNHRIILLRPDDQTPPSVGSGPSAQVGSSSDPLDIELSATPIPDNERSRGQRAMIKKIAKYAIQHDLSAPDTSLIPAASLRAALADLRDEAKRADLVKKIEAAAAERGTMPPDDLLVETAIVLKATWKQVSHFRG